MKEIWKPIYGYTGIYEVSNHGRVRSLDRLNGRGYKIKGRVLKHVLGTCTYPSVFLSKNGKQTQETVHKLVAKTFMGPKPKDKEIDHLDNNRLNPRLDNLEYVSHRENSTRGKKSRLNPNKTSQYVGVSWESKIKKWVVYKSFNGKTYNLGCFICEKEASRIYEKIKTKRQAESQQKKNLERRKKKFYSKVVGVSYYKNSGWWYFRPKGKFIKLFKTKKAAEDFARSYK